MSAEGEVSRDAAWQEFLKTSRDFTNACYALGDDEPDPEDLERFKLAHARNQAAMRAVGAEQRRALLAVEQPEQPLTDPDE